MFATYRIKKLLTKLVPFPSVRRELRARVERAKPYMPDDDFIRLVARKRKSFDLAKPELAALVLGSSHADYGFDPSFFGAPAFSLGMASEDLYTSYKLYELHGANLPKLRTVVFFFSVFTPGFYLIKCSEQLRMAVYKAVFDVPYPERKYWFWWENRARRLAASVGAEPGFNGFWRPEVFLGTDYPLELRVAGHLKHNGRSAHQLEWLRKLSDLCMARGHRLVLAVPPAREDYRAALPDPQTLFASLYSLAGGKHLILNYYADDSFTREDFGDTDHLNSGGAAKLTTKIKESLS